MSYGAPFSTLPGNVFYRILEEHQPYFFGICKVIVIKIVLENICDFLHIRQVIINPIRLICSKL